MEPAFVAIALASDGRTEEGRHVKALAHIIPAIERHERSAATACATQIRKEEEVSAVSRMNYYRLIEEYLKEAARTDALCCAPIPMHGADDMRERLRHRVYELMMETIVPGLKLVPRGEERVRLYHALKALLSGKKERAAADLALLREKHAEPHA